MSWYWLGRIFRQIIVSFKKYQNYVLFYQEPELPKTGRLRNPDFGSGSIASHFKMNIEILVPLCLNSGRDEFVFIPAASNLTLVQSLVIKQIISAPDPSK